MSGKGGEGAILDSVIGKNTSEMIPYQVPKRSHPKTWARTTQVGGTASVRL